LNYCSTKLSIGGKVFKHDESIKVLIVSSNNDSIYFSHKRTLSIWRRYKTTLFQTVPKIWSNLKHING